MRCYYEVLGVERKATEAELKRAYRKMALKWHPDKNQDQKELAEEMFKELTAAYSVLNDPHERAWYDAHRTAILAGRDEEDDDYNEYDGINLYTYFAPSCFDGFGSDAKSFYTVYAGVFATLDREETENEEEAGAHEPLPAFGHGGSDYQSEVRVFYSFWLSFATCKTFAWCDKYNLADAPDRRVRRAMEKENKRERDKARKEFNGLVRELVEFVRKRDPRVARARREREESEAERARVEAEAREARVREARERNAAAEREVWEERLNDEQFMQVDDFWEEMDAAKKKGRGGGGGGARGDDGDGDDEDADDVPVVMSAKARKKAKREAKRKQQEEKRRRREAAQNAAGTPPPAHDAAAGDAGVGDSAAADASTPTSASGKVSWVGVVSDDSDDDDWGKGGGRRGKRGKQKRKKKRGGGMQQPASPAAVDDVAAGVAALGVDGDEQEAAAPPRKLSAKEKRRLRQAKKKAAAAEAGEDTMCKVCGNAFPSRSKLFAHIRKTGHAALKDA